MQTDEMRPAEDLQQPEHMNILLLQQIKNIVTNRPVETRVDHPNEGFRKVQEAIAYLSSCLDETNVFLKQLAHGDLNAPTPGRHNFFAGNLKELHAGLRHLTWQAGQVANGDYKQKVSFLGEFSDSFNAMIQQLQEREDKLTAQASELTESMDLMLSIMNRVKEWVIAVDQETDEVIYVNRSAEEHYYDSEKENFRCENLCGHRCMLMQKLMKMRLGQLQEKQFHFACPSCERILWVESNRIRWSERQAHVYFIEDVTREIGEREELQSMAYQDELTGIYNRRYCMTQLSHMINSRKLFSLCVVDLNRLKVVNDAYGHLKGDEYIVTISEEMKRLVADTASVVCRVGGDEFVLLLPDMGQAQAHKLLEQLAHNVSEAAKTKEFPMSISYGVVDVLPRTAIALDRILQEADERMYEMKEKAHRLLDLNETISK